MRDSVVDFYYKEKARLLPVSNREREREREIAWRERERERERENLYDKGGHGMPILRLKSGFSQSEPGIPMGIDQSCGGK